MLLVDVGITHSFLFGFENVPQQLPGLKANSLLVKTAQGQQRERERESSEAQCRGAGAHPVVTYPPPPPPTKHTGASAGPSAWSSPNLLWILQKVLPGC